LGMLLFISVMLVTLIDDVKLTKLSQLLKQFAYVVTAVLESNTPVFTVVMPTQPMKVDVKFVAFVLSANKLAGTSVNSVTFWNVLWNVSVAPAVHASNNPNGIDSSAVELKVFWKDVTFVHALNKPIGIVASIVQPKKVELKLITSVHPANTPVPTVVMPEQPWKVDANDVAFVLSANRLAGTNVNSDIEAKVPVKVSVAPAVQLSNNPDGMDVSAVALNVLANEVTFVQKSNNPVGIVARTVHPWNVETKVVTSVPPSNTPSLTVVMPLQPLNVSWKFVTSVLSANRLAGTDINSVTLWNVPWKFVATIQASNNPDGIDVSAVPLKVLWKFVAAVERVNKLAGIVARTVHPPNVLLKVVAAPPSNTPVLTVVMPEQLENVQ
jgi:hypothetical protein